MSTDSFDMAALRREIKPFKLHWFPRLRSTSDHAAILRKRGELYAPAIVLTGRQIAGRGRGSNTWWSSRGCITATFVFPVEEHLAAHQIPLIAGLAVRNGAAELTGETNIKLKWPNDVVFRERKLAGLLCERVMKADLIGVGLNVNLDPADAPRGLRDQITSLSAIAGAPIDLTAALIAVAHHLNDALRRRGERFFAETLKQYDAHHALNGRRVTVIDGSAKPQSGRCEGIDREGRLILRERGKIHRIIAGQVQLHPL